MTAPRFFSFLLWLTNSPFAFFQARRRILAKFATAAFPLRTVMRLLRCPFSGVMIFLVSPGMQVVLLSLPLSYPKGWHAAWCLTNCMLCCAVLCFAAALRCIALCKLLLTCCNAVTY